MWNEPLHRVSALRRTQCNDCGDCYAVCPEPQVIKPALKGAEQGRGPMILSPNCTNCGRCIDGCSNDVFAFATRFSNRNNAQAKDQRLATRFAEALVQPSSR